MRRPLIVGNWKMQGSRQSSKLLAAAIANAKRAPRSECVICPANILLTEIAEQLSESDVRLGAQNLSEFDSGAYTGEVSAAMLQDAGCSYVLVGHSERRLLFGESSRSVAQKFTTAYKAGLVPILCIGETLEEREAGKTLAVLSEQLREVVDMAGLAAVTSAVIAYEPVWAIGSGRVASPEQAQEVLAFIRASIGVNAEVTRLLYGGSVTTENATALFSQPDIDGFLVGGASLKSEQFLTICEATEI